MADPGPLLDRLAGALAAAIAAGPVASEARLAALDAATAQLAAAIGLPPDPADWPPLSRAERRRAARVQRRLGLGPPPV